jgi:hypothetical protein
MPAPETADELRTKIAHYQQTRRTAARSMHRWLDALIADAQETLRLLAGPDEDDDEIPPAPPGRRPDVRSTYPFDEHAPRQRIH